MTIQLRNAEVSDEACCVELLSELKILTASNRALPLGKSFRQLVTKERGQITLAVEGENVLSLPELRTKSITEIQATAQEMGIENISRARRQDITFSILKAHAAEDKSIFGEGVLEILQDGLDKNMDQLFSMF